MSRFYCAAEYQERVVHAEMKRVLLALVCVLALLQLVCSAPAATETKKAEKVVVDEGAAAEPEPSATKGAAAAAVKSSSSSGGITVKKGCPVLAACTREFSPVCGDDGETYSNTCQLNVKNCKSDKVITKAKEGHCDEKSIDVEGAVVAEPVAEPASIKKG